MKTIVFVVCMVLAFLTGCANKTVAPEPVVPFTPLVTVTDDSDPLPAWMIPHVIKRTDSFCRDSGRPGVEEIAIHYTAFNRHANVVYICFTDPRTIEEIATSSVPFRVTDEDLGKDGEISYLSSKAIYCLYVDPNGCRKPVE